MSSQLSSKEDRQRLNEIFKAFDKNNDGQLSREELIQGYTQLYGGPEYLPRATMEVDIILKKIDSNGSGSVDYSGIVILV